MKKLLIAAVLIVPAIWAGITWFTSSETEEVFEQMLTESNQNLTESFPFVKVEKQSFEKGFTSSTAKSIVSLNTEMLNDEGEEEPVELIMNHTIYHGPVMMTPDGLKTGTSYVRTTLDQKSLSAETKELLKLLFDGKEPFVSGIQTGVGDSIDIDLEIAPMSFDAEKHTELTGEEADSDDPELISFAGMTGHITTNTGGTRLNGTMDIGAMEMKAKDEGKDILITMASSIVNMNINELYKGSILDGSVVMEIPEFSFSDGEKSSAIFHGLRIVSKAEEENGKFGGFASFDIDKLLIKSPDAPVEFPESKVHLGFAVKGFDRDAVIKLVDLGQEMRTSQFALLGNDDPDQVGEVMLKSMGAYYAALGETIKQGVGIDTDLELSNDTGKSAVNLDLNYAEAKQLYDLKTVRELIMALQGQLKITIDKSMIAGTPAEEAIGMPVAMGFAVDKGDAYEAVADLGGGELKVNGEPMPVLDMLGGMIDQPIPWEILLDSQ